MSFLKKLGLGIFKAATLAGTSVDIITDVKKNVAVIREHAPGGLPDARASDIVSKITRAALAVELSGLKFDGAVITNALTGEAKLAALIVLITAAIEESEKRAGYECANPELQRRAIAGYAQATVDLLNSRKPL